MKFDDLFEQRSLVGAKLKDCIKGQGYTKVSFAKFTGISRPTIDKLINGEVDNKSTFDKHINKIMAALNMSVEELLYYEINKKAQENEYIGVVTNDCEMSDKAKKQYGLLMDIVRLCENYY